MISYYLKTFISIFFNLLSLAIIIRVLLSWFQAERSNAAFSFLTDITDPILNSIKKIVPPIGGVMDVSPIIAIFGLNVLESVLMYLIALMNI